MAAGTAVLTTVSPDISSCRVHLMLPVHWLMRAGTSVGQLYPGKTSLGSEGCERGGVPPTLTRGENPVPWATQAWKQWIREFTLLQLLHFSSLHWLHNLTPTAARPSNPFAPARLGAIAWEEITASSRWAASRPSPPFSNRDAQRHSPLSTGTGCRSGPGRGAALPPSLGPPPPSPPWMSPAIHWTSCESSNCPVPRPGSGSRRGTSILQCPLEDPQGPFRTA